MNFLSPPRRVVSLVPSYTESLFDLGLGSRLVGVSDYCIFPVHGVAGLLHLGGTKNPDIHAIMDLQPDLVLANQEENTPAVVNALRAAGLEVWLTFPKTVVETIQLLFQMAHIFHSDQAIETVRSLERSLEWAKESMAENLPRRYFCPIWQEMSADTPAWWMTFNQDTYCADVLRYFGGLNVFAERQRRYPLQADLGTASPQPAEGRDTRYPRVTLEEIVAAAPEFILLPSEPFEYKEEHRESMFTLLAEAPAAKNGNIHLVDGTLITWCGTRLAHALTALPDIFQ